MRIGIDFDNTIVCYDQLFHRVAKERGLIGDDVPVSKEAVRNYLRATGREDDWTEMQGYVYGARMGEAQAFAGVAEFFTLAHARGLTLSIISHKTRHPYKGPPYDLHSAARGWLSNQPWYGPHIHTFFELTKEDKLKRIASQRCDYFIDDLPEFLAEPAFPVTTQRLLFSPADTFNSAFKRMHSWFDITAFLL